MILGIVEGITEFLPISSTAHLMIASKILGLAQTDFVKSFEIVIQFGAIAAVLFVFGERALRDRFLWKKVLIAFVPTAVVGYILYSVIKTYLIGNFFVAASGLIVGGIALILLENYHPSRIQEGFGVEHITSKQAFVIGLVQSIAIIPGISRSATTIVCSRLFGASRKAAAEFSFLLAVPTVAAASGYDFLKHYKDFDGSNHFPLLIVGFFFSFFSALIAIRFLINYIQNNSFTTFGIYRIIVAIALLFVLMHS